MPSDEHHMSFKVWCPVCEERAFLDDKDAAIGLAENHDENYHDGKRQALVSGRRESA